MNFSNYEEITTMFHEKTGKTGAELEKMVLMFYYAEAKMVGRTDLADKISDRYNKVA